MSAIDGILVVDLDQPSFSVVHLLPETDRLLAGVDLLYVPSTPSLPSLHGEDVPTPSIGHFQPIVELALVLLSGCHAASAAAAVGDPTQATSALKDAFSDSSSWATARRASSNAFAAPMTAEACSSGPGAS
jgi:hypothetical protein